MTMFETTLTSELARERSASGVWEDGQGDLSRAGLVARGRGSPIDRRVLDPLTPDPNDVYEIIPTSATTGQPKGVMHTHNTWFGIRLQRHLARTIQLVARVSQFRMRQR